MQLHYHKQESKIVFKKCIQNYEGLFYKKINKKLDIYKKKQISFRNGKVIRKTWIQDIDVLMKKFKIIHFTKEDVIQFQEILQISQEYYKSTLLHQGLEKILVIEVSQMKNIMNFKGQLNILITQNFYYIDEMNFAINEDLILLPLGIKIQPLIKYNKLKFIKIAEQTYCLQQINQQQCSNILIHKDKLIPFYVNFDYQKDNYYIQMDTFYLLQQQQLQMINQHGIEQY
ncbi:unnamed protein product [Paramecium sonneborni]|uniref:Uncharacterized protein n=1 Tax=Paramecium sonneborni TaxID=65129 RepID=A0A8S1KAH7_9CILI|nr:unnamed protein product [Paramecium sonneborni]